MDDDELAALPPLMLLMLPTLIRELHCHRETHDPFRLVSPAMDVPVESIIAIKDLSQTLGGNDVAAANLSRQKLPISA